MRTFSGSNERFLAGDAEGKAGWSTRRDEFSYRFAMAGDDYIAFLDQLEKPGKLRFGLMHVHLHGFELSSFT